MECCAKRPALSSMEPLQMGTTRRAAGARESQRTGGQGGVRWVAPTTSGAASVSVVLADAAPVSTAAVASREVDHGTGPTGHDADGVG